MYINSLDPNLPGNSWDTATFLLTANHSTTLLSFSSSTKGGTGLALTDVRLLDLSSSSSPSSSSHHPTPLLSPAWRVRVLLLSLLSGLVLLGALGALLMHARGGLQWEALPNWQRMEEDEGRWVGRGGGGGYHPVSVGDSPFAFDRRKGLVELYKRRGEVEEEEEEVFYRRGVNGGGGGGVESSGLPSRFEGMEEEGYGSTRGGGGTWKSEL